MPTEGLEDKLSTNKYIYNKKGPDAHSKPRHIEIKKPRLCRNQTASKSSDSLGLQCGA